MADRYDPTEIEPKWQERWERDALYHADDDDPRPKWYALTMFPYTSGNLHIGHWFAIAPSDVQARFMRMRGHNVMFPIGFDAFGLPAENAALKQGIHPAKWTWDNVATMRGQLKSMGASFDWQREIVTCDPAYYRWTQWWFLKLFETGLAYRAEAPANWCPGCQTVLANEQVKDGACERCGSVVSRRSLEQWFFRITKYAEELLDFGKLQWPEQVMTMQRNWIGRSEGAELSFALEQPAGETQEIRVFTTRPDTVYGVTFMVVAPEHPLVAALTTPDHRAEVDAYVAAAARATEIDRLSTEGEKTGVFTGAYCVNRLSGNRVPIYIADYVLYSYGTGAVMGVPAHDQRDFEFARKYGIPIVQVITPVKGETQALDAAYVEPGSMIDSGPFDGQTNAEGWQGIADKAEREGIGRRTITYRLRDWLISRQRYWGAPIPIVYCEKDGIVPLREDQLPVLLPDDAEFLPTGQSPLALHQGFLHTTCPKCDGPARRETDTMDTFMCSNWYYLRYVSPHFDGGPIDPALAPKWLPVDQYTGGAEHAVMHLLYARFFTKAARDIGVVAIDEPFTRLFNQGQIMGPDGQRMSKSRGNVVAPDQQVSRYGADAFRCYLMFLGPWDQGGPYDDSGFAGLSRWLHRAWTIATEETPTTRDGESARAVRSLAHRTIQRVTEDIEKFRFNTMLAALMEYTNGLARLRDAGPVDGAAWTEAIESLILMLAPAAPHIAEELWERSGHSYSVHTQAWPRWDTRYTTVEAVTIVVQVNGKLRDRIQAPTGLSEAQAMAQAMASGKVRPFLDGKAVGRTIYVPDKLLNIVIG
ncbi:MAG: leucine--tRNA ligase [Dehalococcoidia bacterium]|nr:leucine--tRNA ligase [Dehalococcoidia bacterium]